MFAACTASSLNCLYRDKEFSLFQGKRNHYNGLLSGYELDVVSLK
jgi:hypothetical protein